MRRPHGWRVPVVQSLRQLSPPPPLPLCLPCPLHPCPACTPSCLALQYGWGYSFVLPGVAIAVMGVAVYSLLVVQPSDVGLASAYEPVRVDDNVGGA